MKKLSLKSCQTQTCSDVISVEFENALDETMIAQFTPLWPLLTQKKIQILILDFNRTREFSPSGLGFIAGLLMTLPHWVSEVWAVHCSPELKQALETMAPDVWRHIGTPSDAELMSITPLKNHAVPDAFFLDAPSAQIISGMPFTLRLEARNTQGERLPGYTGLVHIMADHGMISPTLISGIQNGIWEGQVTVTGPGEVKLRVWDEWAEGTATLQVVESGDKIHFPYQLACPGCGKTNIASKADISRCVVCNQIYFVDLRGHVIPLKAGSYAADGILRHLNFKIPSDINYLNLVRNFIVGIAHEENIGEEHVSQIEMALDEALANVVEHAYTYDCYQDVEIRLCLYADKLEILIIDQGRIFDGNKMPLPNLKEHIEQRKVGGLGRYLMNTLMDEVEYHRRRGANELRMMKRFLPRSRE